MSRFNKTSGVPARVERPAAPVAEAPVEAVAPGAEAGAIVSVEADAADDPEFGDGQPVDPYEPVKKKRRLGRRKKGEE